MLGIKCSGFSNIELNGYYQRYVQREGKNALSPREWALRQTRGFPRKEFERILGKDYVRRTREIGSSKRIKNLSDIPKPKDYSPQTINKHLQTCWDNREQAIERLSKFRDEILTISPDLRGRALKEVNEGILRIFKGNIGEILSRGIQTKILKKVAPEIVKKFPGVKIKDVILISGVRIKLPGNNSPLLFSDNIIATLKNGNLQVRGVIEVKAGYKGGSEATTQIFDWIEKRLEEGAQLIIPKNSRVMDIAGREVITQSSQIYTYFPDSSLIKRVEFLATADRYIITAKGKSYLGLESASQIAPKVSRFEMGVTSEQIDYLMKILLPKIIF